MQVDPIKPTLKPLGTKHLKPKYDKPLSSVPFNFNLRCYSQVGVDEVEGGAASVSVKYNSALRTLKGWPLEAGAYTCPLFSST